MAWTPLRLAPSVVPQWKCRATTSTSRSAHDEYTTIGLDLGKLVFQVHGVDARGKTCLRKQLKRAEMMKFFTKL